MTSLSLSGRESRAPNVHCTGAELCFRTRASTHGSITTEVEKPMEDVRVRWQDVIVRLEDVRVRLPVHLALVALATGLAAIALAGKRPAHEGMTDEGQPVRDAQTALEIEAETWFI